MKKSQSNYFRMFLNTQDYLDNQSQVWASIPIINNYKNETDEIIARISEKSDVVQKGIGVSARKTSLKSTLGLKVSSLSGILQAYAYGLDNMDLANKVKLSKTDLERLKDQDVEAKVNMLISTAREHLEELADYGLCEAMLTEISTSLNDFTALIGKPRSILNTKYVAIDSLDKLFDECNKLLNNKLDKIMMMYRETNPEFYNGYKRSRTIVDS